MNSLEHLGESILKYARPTYTALRREFTVQQALEVIRREGVAERIIYFYVVDADDVLVGVLPTRRLLVSSPDRSLSDIMVPRAVAIPETATVMDACEMFVLYKFLAFPVVDSKRRIRGVVDVNLLTEEITAEAGETERQRVDEVFETIGLRLSEVRDASPFRAFRARFPWLLTTVGSGTVAAFLAGAYETTLAQSIVLAFFLTLVLGLGESVGAQSMTVTIQGLRARSPSLPWFWQALRRELVTALLLGLGCGLLVALVVVVWRGPGMPAVVIGGSIMLSLCTACLLGLGVPSLLHALKLDPKIAAGPITLAAADICTLLFYLNLGRALL